MNIFERKREIILPVCIFLFHWLSSSVKTAESGVKNIFMKEKENYLFERSNKGLEFSYVICNKVFENYNPKQEIYISVIDPGLKNFLKIQYEGKDDLREKYSGLYENLLGPTIQYFPNSLISNFTAFYNFTNNQTSFLDLKSEILIEKISNNDIIIKIMRNPFFADFDINNCADMISTITKYKTFLKFYEMTFILMNSEICNMTHVSNSVLNSFENVFFFQDYSEITSKIHSKNFNFIYNNAMIDKKIIRKQILNKYIEDYLTTLPDCRLNLKNYMIEKDINFVNDKLEHIISMIIYLDSYLDKMPQMHFDVKLEKLTTKMKEFQENMKKFKIHSHKGKHNFYFVILICIIGFASYFIFRTLQAIKQSYNQKIK
jgi:hypothetical protein